MPAVSETTDHAEHFGICTACSTSVGGGGGGSGLPLEIIAFSAYSHPTILPLEIMGEGGGEGFGLPLEIMAFSAYSHPTILS